LSDDILDILGEAQRDNFISRLKQIERQHDVDLEDFYDEVHYTEFDVCIDYLRNKYVNSRNT
jgi:hypothetical protein